jgi:hypothetical protein
MDGTMPTSDAICTACTRRVPRVEQAGEPDIARSAAALREKAVQRLSELDEHSTAAALFQTGDHLNVNRF